MHHDKLDLMINKTWLYNTRLVKILSYKIDEGKCVKEMTRTGLLLIQLM